MECKFSLLVCRKLSVDAITVLDVSHTGIATLPLLVFQLKHLTSLDAQSNKLKALPASGVESGIWNVPNLREVRLITSHSHIHTTTCRPTLVSYEWVKPVSVKLLSGGGDNSTVCHSLLTQRLFGCILELLTILFSFHSQLFHTDPRK